MNPDPTSLDNLRDIVTPAPVSWWPPAPGWWGVLCLLGVVALLGCFRTWRSWRANAFRRAALRELQTAESVRQIAGILKRTAMCAFPRTEIAALSGTAWCNWLSASAGQPVPESVGQALTLSIYSSEAVEHFADVQSFAAQWVQTVNATQGDATQGHSGQDARC